MVGDWEDARFAGRPVPDPDGVSAEYWAAVLDGQLLFQECPVCAHRQFYPRTWCTRCGAMPEWLPASGRGTVYTYTVVRQNGAPPFASLVPYVVAMIDLEEGPRLMGNVIDCDPDDVTIGMAVTACAVRIDDHSAAPFWRPAVPAGGQDSPTDQDSPTGQPLAPGQDPTTGQ